MAATTIPDGFVEEKRGGALMLLRADLAAALLAAGVDRPERFAAACGVVRTYRGRSRAVLLDPPDGSGPRLVLRAFRHGGATGSLFRGLFLRGDRAREELEVLLAAARCGVDTARPVAAVRRRVAGPIYRAHLVTEEVEVAEDLVARLAARDRGEPSPPMRVVLEETGRALRRCHDAGIRLPDLHVKNVLVRSDRPERPVLIDFDRARIRPGPADRALGDLFRLDRSVEKLVRTGVGIARGERARLFRGYRNGDRISREERRAPCRRYRRHLALHRFSWRLRGK